MTSPTLPNPTPTVTPETEPMWKAADEGRLLVTRCDQCHTYLWYPRAVCSACSTMDVSWHEVSGRATVYSYTVVRRGSGLYKDATPYVLAYVALQEGPCMLTNVVDCDIADVRIGLEVEVVFHHSDAGQAFPRFRPREGAA